MRVEIAYANQQDQALLLVEVDEGVTVQQAIEKSGILVSFPEIELQQASVGIFSRKANLTDILQPRDRVEIYRPLQLDPKAARRLRAERAGKKHS